MGSLRNDEPKPQTYLREQREDIRLVHETDDDMRRIDSEDPAQHTHLPQVVRNCLDQVRSPHLEIHPHAFYAWVELVRVPGSWSKCHHRYHVATRCPFVG